MFEKKIKSINSIKKNLTKGEMHLDFEVDIDDRAKLNDFKALLEEAIAIVNKELEKF